MITPILRILWKWLGVFVFIVISVCVGLPQSTTVAENPLGKEICLNFSPYFKLGQDPRQGSFVPPEQIKRGLEAIQPYCDCIRIFSAGVPLDTTAYIAKSMGFETIIVTAWLDSDLNTNAVEIAQAIRLAKGGLADRIVLGSETLLRGELSPSELIEYIRVFKGEVPDVPVSTADVYSTLLVNEELMETVDFVFYNAYPYWEGEPIECAIYRFHQSFLEIQQAAGEKEIIVSETGWPTSGNKISQSEPSLENMLDYLRAIRGWSMNHEVPVYWFEAFDEPWKENPTNPQEGHWGLLEYNAELDSLLFKEGAEDLLSNPAKIDTTDWTCRLLKSPSDTPRIVPTQVPVYGDFDGVLCGYVEGVRPCDCKLVAYIKVNGRWWVKPTYASPATKLSCEGEFCIDVVTGGLDHEATEYRLFLVSADYDTPVIGNKRRLPDSLYADSKTYVVITRTPFEWATLDLADMEVFPGDTISMPVYTENFKEVISFQGGLATSPGIKALGITLGVDNLIMEVERREQNELVFSFSTQDSIPLSFADSSVLFTVEMVVGEDIKTSRAIWFSDQLRPLELVQLVENQPLTIPLRFDRGRIYPLIIPSFHIPDDTVVIGATVSIPILVTDYLNIVEVEGAVKSSPGIQLIGLETVRASDTLEVTTPNDSILIFNFSHGQGQPQNLPDQSVLFRILITLPDKLGVCGTIQLTGKDTIFAQATQIVRNKPVTLPVAQTEQPVICDDLVNVTSLGNTKYKPLSVFPNPAKGETTLEFNAKGSGKGLLLVYNISGQLLLKEQHEISRNENRIILSDLPQLGNGILFIWIYSENGSVWTGKLVRF